MVDVTLKPCPFCGGATKWVEYSEGMPLDEPFGLVPDHQENCFLGPRMMENWDNIFAAWNTRSAPDGEVVAWMYRAWPDEDLWLCQMTEPQSEVEKRPLYAHPPRNDAVVEALRDIQNYSHLPHADRYVIRSMIDKILAALKQGERQ